VAILLHTHTVAVAAGTETAQALGGELDWKRSGNQNRKVAISSATAGDSFLIEGTLDGTSWFSANAALTGATNYYVALVGPFFKLRITKTGTAGSATVTAIV
jgi:hypothetical protein